MNEVFVFVNLKFSHLFNPVILLLHSTLFTYFVINRDINNT